MSGTVKNTIEYQMASSSGSEVHPGVVIATMGLIGAAAIGIPALEVAGVFHPADGKTPIDKRGGHPGQPTHTGETGTGSLGGNVVTQSHSSLRKHHHTLVQEVGPNGPEIEQFGGHPSQPTNHVESATHR
jgi:hypothetical protein